MGFLFSGLTASSGWASSSNFAAWDAIFLQGKFSSQWGWYFENQLRLNDGWEYGSSSPSSLKTRGNRLILRPALRWMPLGDPSFQVWVGYGWLPNLSPERIENRLWQQLSYQGGKIDEQGAWLVRARLEQRHIEYTAGISHRFRAMGRLSRLSPRSGWGAVIWDEVFWNLNAAAGGPASGFDQNRIFLGPVVQLSSGTRLELGYLNNFVAKGSSASSAMTHVLLTSVNLDF
jgi:hypothetical protein